MMTENIYFNNKEEYILQIKDSDFESFCYDYLNTIKEPAYFLLTFFEGDNQRDFYLDNCSKDDLFFIFTKYSSNLLNKHCIISFGSYKEESDFQIEDQNRINIYLKNSKNLLPLLLKYKFRMSKGLDEIKTHDFTKIEIEEILKSLEEINLVENKE